MLKAVENLSAYYANPTRFMRLAGLLHAPVWGLALSVLVLGLYMASGVPDDYQQGCHCAYHVCPCAGGFAVAVRL